MKNSTGSFLWRVAFLQQSGLVLTPPPPPPIPPPVVTPGPLLHLVGVSSSQATNGWLKAIAKLPSLQTLILRGCTKARMAGVNLSASFDRRPEPPARCHSAFNPPHSYHAMHTLVRPPRSCSFPKRPPPPPPLDLKALVHKRGQGAGESIFRNK